MVSESFYLSKQASVTSKLRGSRKATRYDKPFGLKAALVCLDAVTGPVMWYFQFCEWLAHPTYDNGFNQKIAYTCGEAWVIRILAIVAVLLIVVIIMAIIMEIIKIYKKMWDKISQMFLIGSLSGIAVLGDVIREYLPVNLILTFGFINVGIMLLKMYFQKKFEEKSLYADNHYD